MLGGFFWVSYMTTSSLPQNKLCPYIPNIHISIYPNIHISHIFRTVDEREALRALSSQKTVAITAVPLPQTFVTEGYRYFF